MTPALFVENNCGRVETYSVSSSVLYNFFPVILLFFPEETCIASILKLKSKSVTDNNEYFFYTDGRWDRRCHGNY